MAALTLGADAVVGAALRPAGAVGDYRRGAQWQSTSKHTEEVAVFESCPAYHFPSHADSLSLALRAQSSGQRGKNSGVPRVKAPVTDTRGPGGEIGRASCRARV